MAAVLTPSKRGKEKEKSVLLLRAKEEEWFIPTRLFSTRKKI
jgi:hypothetical protein